MKTYIFKTTTTMKSYNSKNWWIDGDIITEKMIAAENVAEALEKYRELVKENHYIIISPHGLRNKQPMYEDTIERASKQCGYVITAKADFQDCYGNWKAQYVDLWVSILTIVDTDFEEG